MVDNPRVQSFERVEDWFTTDYVFVAETELAYGYFRPMSTLSLALDWAIWGENPFGFHLTNVGLHAVATLLVAFLALELGLAGPLAWAAGILFAVHPIHTESVAWIAGRTDVLAFVFAGAALLLHRRGRRAKESPARAASRLAASLVLFVLALLSKEMAVVLPLWVAILAAFDEAHTPLRARIARGARVAAPFFAILLVYLGLRFLVLDIPAPQPPPEHSLGAAVLSAVPTVARYLGWLVWPSEPSAYVQNPYVERLGDPRLWAAAIALLAIGVAIARWTQRGRELSLLALLLAVSFAPILNIVRTAGPADMGAMMAERFAYFPSFPFLLLAVAIAGEAIARMVRPDVRRVAVALAALFVVAAAATAKTVERNRDWRDDVTLFSRETARTPAAPLLWTSLAQAQMRAGRPVESEAALRVAERLTPDAPWVLAVRAQWLTLAGRLSEAVPLQERVVRAWRSKNAVAGNNLAYLYRATGRPDEAMPLLTDLVERLPDYADPWLNLAEIERAQGDAAGAAASYRNYLALRPRDLRAVEPLANLLVVAGAAAEAEAVYLEARRGERGDARIWNNVGALRLGAGDPQGALRALDEAVAIDPAYDRGRFNRAQLWIELGRVSEAEALFAELAGGSQDPAIREMARRALEGGGGPDESPEGGSLP